MSDLAGVAQSAGREPGGLPYGGDGRRRLPAQNGAVPPVVTPSAFHYPEPVAGDLLLFCRRFSVSQVGEGLEYRCPTAHNGGTQLQRVPGCGDGAEQETADAKGRLIEPLFDTAGRRHL